MEEKNTEKINTEAISAENERRETAEDARKEWVNAVASSYALDSRRDPDNIPEPVGNVGPEELDSSGQDVRKKKKRRKLKKGEILILVLPVIAAVSAIVYVNFFVREVSSYTVEKEAVQYYGELELDVPRGTVLTLGSDGKELLKDGESDDVFNSLKLPIYYRNEERLTTTENMLYFEPRSHKYYRVDRLCEVYFDPSHELRVSNGENAAVLHRGFLFNGRNKYIFLEPVEIDLNGLKETYPVFSYAEITPGNEVSLFNYETKEFYTETAEREVTAEGEEQDYTVFLIGNSMETADGWKQLLFSNPELTDPII